MRPTIEEQTRILNYLWALHDAIWETPEHCSILIRALQNDLLALDILPSSVTPCMQALPLETFAARTRQNITDAGAMYQLFDRRLLELQNSLATFHRSLGEVRDMNQTYLDRLQELQAHLIREKELYEVC